LVSDDFVQDLPDEEEKSMKRKYLIRYNIYIVSIIFLVQQNAYVGYSNFEQIVWKLYFTIYYPVIRIEIKLPK